jgi:hypothetical protein
MIEFNHHVPADARDPHIAAMQKAARPDLGTR